MPNVGLRVRKRAGKSLHTAHVLLVQVVAMRADHTLDIATSTTLSGTSIRLPSHTHGPRCVAQRATCPGRGSAIQGRCRQALRQSVCAFCVWVTQYEKWVTQYENWVTQSQLGDTSNLRIAQRGTLDVCQLFVRHIAHSPAGKRVSVLIRVHVSSS